MNTPGKLLNTYNLFHNRTDHDLAEEEKAEATPGGGQDSTSRVSTLSDGIAGAIPF